MIALIICIIIAVVGIVFCIIATIKDEGGWGLAGIIVLMLDGALGFGLFCSTTVDSTSEKQVDFSFAKTQSTVTIETPDKTEIFRDAYTFTRISDSSKVLLHTDYNVYGQETHSRLVVK